MESHSCGMCRADALSMRLSGEYLAEELRRHWRFTRTICAASVKLRPLREMYIMQSLHQLSKPKSARKSAKPRDKFVLPADEYLRSNPANEKALHDAIAAAERGELVEFDPRKK